MIKLLRQKRVEQIRELNTHIDNEKKLQAMLKSEMSSNSRQNRSNIRNKSRETSNPSNGRTTSMKSTGVRREKQFSRNVNEEREPSEYYMLTKSDTVKKLEPVKSDQVVQPKIRGKDHNQIITAELLK